MTGARRLDPPSNLGWEVHVGPSSDAGVAVVLPVTTDCGAQGAICTQGGRKLSNRLEFTVSGAERVDGRAGPTGATKPALALCSARRLRALAITSAAWEANMTSVSSSSRLNSKPGPLLATWMLPAFPP